MRQVVHYTSALLLAVVIHRPVDRLNVCFVSAVANLRAVLEAMSRSNPAAATASHPMPPGAVMMPGAVVLISNLNEKVNCSILM